MNRSRTRALLLGLLTAATGGAATTPTVTLNVATNVPALAIPPRFIGLSFETAVLKGGTFQAENNADMIGLFNGLGPGLLRIGGASVELRAWDSTGNGAGGGASVSFQDLQRLADFLRATDWKVLYGLNMGRSNPTLAGSEAHPLDSILGDRLAEVEIGNEVDNYAGVFRPAVWPFESYRTEWDSFRLAMIKRDPRIVFTGPATAHGPSSWVDSFALEEAKNISTLTFHYYLANGKDTVHIPTVGRLLGKDALMATRMRGIGDTAVKYRIPDGFRVTETNSYYGGGAPGVSNSYSSALWTVYYMYTLAVSGGCAGLNFHTSGTGSYSPIAAQGNPDTIVEVRPMYYGMRLFSMASRGAVRPAAMSDSLAWVSAWTVDDSDGSRHFVVLNADSANPLSATLVPGTGFVQWTSYALVGKGVHDTTGGTTLGGAPIAKNGAWNPVPKTGTVAGSLQTTLAPASALLVTFRKNNSSIATRTPIPGLHWEGSSLRVDTPHAQLFGTDGKMVPATSRAVGTTSWNLSSAPHGVYVVRAGAEIRTVVWK
jgi:hypothetical protein